MHIANTDVLQNRTQEIPQNRSLPTRYLVSTSTGLPLPVASPANVPRMRTSSSSLICNAKIKHINKLGTIKLADLGTLQAEIEKCNGLKRSLHPSQFPLDKPSCRPAATALKAWISCISGTSPRIASTRTPTALGRPSYK